jgi:hypothetical protein
MYQVDICGAVWRAGVSMNVSATRNPSQSFRELATEQNEDHQQNKGNDPFQALARADLVFVLAAPSNIDVAMPSSIR